MARKCGDRGRRGEGAAVTLLFSAESLRGGEVKSLKMNPGIFPMGFFQEADLSFHPELPGGGGERCWCRLSDTTASVLTE